MQLANHSVNVHWVEMDNVPQGLTAIDQKGRAKASDTITKDDGVTVIEAEIGGIFPGLEERKVLSQMLQEGDPTNGPTNTQQATAEKPKT